MAITVVADRPTRANANPFARLFQVVSESNNFLPMREYQVSSPIESFSTQSLEPRSLCYQISNVVCSRMSVRESY